MPLSRRKKRLLIILATVVATLLIALVSFLVYLDWEFRPRPGPADYDTEYIESAKGEVKIEIPEVFELANIIIAITEYGLEAPYSVRREGEYFEKVQRHFLQYNHHPLIASLGFSKNTSFSRYYGFRENSARYRFDGDRIVLNGLYPKRWRWWPDEFTQNVELVEEFARETGFREFYEQNMPFYEEQVRKYGERVAFKRVWEWLEENFPQRYDAYKIVFSPLVGGSHSTQHCEGDGFTELIAFVSGPGTDVDIWDAVREGGLARVAFTEIDHHYVNPTTWDRWFSVGRSFYRLEYWNRQGGYQDPVSTFNEYMTWAVFLLYADERYDEAEFEEIKAHQTDIMVNRRKFVRFEEFSAKMLALYRGREVGQTIPDLYPEILAWAEEEQANPSSDAP